MAKGLGETGIARSVSEALLRKLDAEETRLADGRRGRELERSRGTVRDLVRGTWSLATLTSAPFSLSDVGSTLYLGAEFGLKKDPPAGLCAARAI